MEATSVTRTEKRGGCHPRKKMMKDGPGEQLVISKTTKTCIKQLSLHARVAAEIVNSGLASTATQDDAHQQAFRVLLHSQLTDRCQKPKLKYSSIASSKLSSEMMWEANMMVAVNFKKAKDRQPRKVMKDLSKF